MKIWGNPRSVYHLSEQTIYTPSLTVYPQPNGDGKVSLLHLKRAATDRFFLFRMTKPSVTLTGEMCLWEDETPIGTGLPMLFDFLDEVRISK